VRVIAPGHHQGGHAQIIEMALQRGLVERAPARLVQDVLAVAQRLERTGQQQAGGQPRCPGQARPSGTCSSGAYSSGAYLSAAVSSGIRPSASRVPGEPATSMPSLDAVMARRQRSALLPSGRYRRTRCTMGRPASRNARASAATGERT
jgi:hypothetical protein